MEWFMESAGVSICGLATPSLKTTYTKSGLALLRRRSSLCSSRPPCRTSRYKQKPIMLFRRTAIALSRRAAFTPISRRTFATSRIRRDDADPKRDIKRDPEEKHHRLDPIPGQTEDMIPFDGMHNVPSNPFLAIGDRNTSNG